MQAFSNPSGMHSFGNQPGPSVQRSQFKKPFRHKTTIDSGLIYPVMIEEILPGDTYNIDLTAISRLSTPLHPIMDNMYLDWFFFFVPNRLVWDHWVNFQGERVDPDDTIDYLVPQVPAPATTGFVNSTLYDYLGIRPGYDGFSVNNLIPRGYNLIYNEWFRSPWLQDSVVVDKDDGPDDAADYVLLRRGKRSDYFTSCLPSPQRDDTGVLLPLGDSAPVRGDGKVLGFTNGSITTGLSNAGSYAQFGTSGYGYNLPRNAAYVNHGAVDNYYGVSTDGDYSGLTCDLDEAVAASVNDIREAFALQRILEMDARGGTRYTELLQNFWGVNPEDSRLQRPEYLGGGSRPIEIQAIPQTSETGTTPLGTLGAVGYNQTRGVGMSKSFTEHGHLFLLCSVRADQTYQQGLRRMWSRRTRYDFPMPQTAHLGEMAVLNKEIFMDGSANDDLVFGYMPHWDDMRYMPSMVTGKLRSDYATSLDPWHLAPDFSTCPTLGPDFIVEDPPIDRVVKVPSEPQFILDVFCDIKAARCLPMFSVPGMLDHF